MATLTLACGPYVDDESLIAIVILFLVIKPLAYFAFVQAFRYRVSRAVPMRFSQAAGLAMLRTLVGAVAFGLGALVSWRSSDPNVAATGWVFLYAERIACWWAIGRWGAGLNGRRLLGWVVSGTLLNAGFDAAVVAGLLMGAVPMALTTAAIAAFILALHVIGRRDALRRRFGASRACARCGYDLTGNLSGRCAECGEPVESALNPC